MRRRVRIAVVSLVAVAMVGCSAGSSYYVTTPTNFAGEESAGAYASGGAPGRPMPAGEMDYYPESIAATASMESAPSSSRARERPADMVAQNAAQPPPAVVVSGATGPRPVVAVDSPAVRDLIIYTADIVLAIYEVDATQRRIAGAATEAGGFIATLDSQTLVIRIPAAQFDPFLARIESEGRVLGRRIQADDVTEQFRDLQIRIENLAAMRERLESMLAHAANIQEAIAVERELERVTVELEAMRGRLRFLADRVAFSTITIRFQPLPREQLAGNVPLELPVSWLRSLGLSNLMR